MCSSRQYLRNEFVGDQNMKKIIENTELLKNILTKNFGILIWLKKIFIFNKKYF